MADFFAWLSGKKTYVVAVLVAALGVLQGLEIFTVPDGVYAVLGALGLGTLRAGVSKAAKAAKDLRDALGSGDA